MGCGSNSTAPVTGNADSCGVAEVERLTRTSLSGGSFPEYTYTLGSERYYDFYIHADSICTDKHVSAQFEAEAYHNPDRPINFIAALEWYVLWEKRDSGAVNVIGDRRHWFADIQNVGLKQQYGENAGQCYINIYAHFRSLGTDAQDSVYLVQNFLFCDAKFFYNYHKPSGSISSDIDPESYKNFPLAQNTNRKELFSNIPVAEVSSNKRVSLSYKLFSKL
jgi:hypothetical protein